MRPTFSFMLVFCLREKWYPMPYIFHGDFLGSSIWSIRYYDDVILQFHIK